MQIYWLDVHLHIYIKWMHGASASLPSFPSSSAYATQATKHNTKSLLHYFSDFCAAELAFRRTLPFNVLGFLNSRNFSNTILRLNRGSHSVQEMCHYICSQENEKRRTKNIQDLWIHKHEILLRWRLWKFPIDDDHYYARSLSSDLGKGNGYFVSV